MAGGLGGRSAWRRSDGVTALHAAGLTVPGRSGPSLGAAECPVPPRPDGSSCTRWSGGSWRARGPGIDAHRPRSGGGAGRPLGREQSSGGPGPRDAGAAEAGSGPQLVAAAGGCSRANPSCLRSPLWPGHRRRSPEPGGAGFALMCRRAWAARAHAAGRSVPGCDRAYLDVAWEDIGLVVEIDGVQHEWGVVSTHDHFRERARHRAATACRG